MRRLPVAYRSEAQKDLLDIFHTVRRISQNVATARGFVQRIKDRCERIGDAPHGGRPRDDLELGLRMVPFEHTTVIVYRVEAKRVRVTNVFYDGRDFESLYRTNDPQEDASAPSRD